MIGGLIRMAAGRALGRQLGGVAGGPMGMAAGAALPFVLRRFGPMGMVAAAAGAYAFKKYRDRSGKAGTGAATARYPGGTDPNLSQP